MSKILFKSKLAGISLLEMIVVIAFIASLLVGGYQVFNISLATVERARQYTLAELMGHDLIELTISKRNEDWNSLVVGQYHFTEDAAQGLLFTTGPETVGDFVRYVQISNVQRDGNGNIVDSGGIVDPDTRHIEAIVSWSYRGRDYEVRLVQYLTNWRRF